MFRVGNDVGGTFTDTIFLDERDGSLTVGKVLTTPEDPSKGVLDGILGLGQQLGQRPNDIRNLIHGTTLVANALIERRGAKTGMITTRGFRDIIEGRTEKRYDLYDIFIVLPEPLVPRYLRLEVTERIDETGAERAPLDEQEARTVVNRLIRHGVEAVAICFLHSYQNPSHERAVADIISGLAPTMPVSVSSRVVAKIREYPRFSTTVANAYTQPLMSRYVTTLERKLQEVGYEGTVHVMLSGGGITTSDVAQEFPIRVAESGPAAGAIAASFYARLLDLRRVLSFDMGGTTAKICFVEDGKPMIASNFEVARIHRFKKGSGLPINLPAVDMIEIGAGGGSIARVDQMGLLKVGPESAGAQPGPACYGRGGWRPTVTDADLLLGYLDPDYFNGGKMQLVVNDAENAVDGHVAKPLGLDRARAAWGIHQVVNENMVNAARTYAAERGKDVRSYALVAFGGAGPLHACAIAGRLGIDKVVVPLGAGVLSALGFLAAPFAFDVVRTYMSALDRLSLAELNRLLSEMESEVVGLMLKAGMSESDITLARTCEMRHLGQGHEIETTIPPGVLDEGDRAKIRAAFDEQYERLYLRTYPSYGVECLNWRVRASAPAPQLKLRQCPRRASRCLERAQKPSRRAYFPELGGFVPCEVYDRYSLFGGARFSGPAIIEERESTVIVNPGATIEVDDYLNLIVRMRGGQE